MKLSWAQIRAFISLLRWGSPVEILGSIISLLAILTPLLWWLYGLLGGDPTTLPQLPVS